jgi:hypothetical protein
MVTVWAGNSSGLQLLPDVHPIVNFPLGIKTALYPSIEITYGFEEFVFDKPSPNKNPIKHIIITTIKFFFMSNLIL